MRKPTGFAIQLNMRFEREESEDDTFFFSILLKVWHCQEELVRG